MSAALDLSPEAWTVSSNEALDLALVDENGSFTFHPTFTYPIYGDAEQIFGYKDLKITLAFDSVTFLPFVNFKYSAKLNGDVEDIEQKLLDVLPEGEVSRNEAEWVEKFKKEQEAFTLPQECIHTYSTSEGEFGVYKTKLATDEKWKKFHKRIQILSLFFIESASYIDDEDDNWSLYLIFDKQTKQVAGYCTAYKYWKYNGCEDFNNNEYKYRGKISQFLVLPQYQGKKHGSALYSAIVDDWMKDESIVEIAVEDPNEGFDDLRDVNDLQRLYKSVEVPSELPISDEWLHETQTKLKLDKRQFMRLVEMFMLLQKSPNFRLQTKKRLYLKNKDLLTDMDIATRNDKIHTAFESLKEDYERILEKSKLGKKRGNSEGPAPKKKAV